MTGMSSTVKKTVSIVFPFIMIFGLQIVFQGGSSPGGGLVGGVVIASGLILLVLAFGRDVLFEKVEAEISLYLACTGLAILLCSSVFLSYGGPGSADAFAGAVVNFANVGLGLLVAGSLTRSFIALSSYRIRREGK